MCRAWRLGSLGGSSSFGAVFADSVAHPGIVVPWPAGLCPEPHPKFQPAQTAFKVQGSQEMMLKMCYLRAYHIERLNWKIGAGCGRWKSGGSVETFGGGNN